MTEIAKKDQSGVLEKVVIEGNLSQLSSAERVTYYRALCESVGLNPLSKPFDYITLQGKLTLYARKDATDQLRALKGISITKLERETTNGVYVVTAYAQDKEGRVDSSIGAVAIDKLSGDALANALMKAETKAKRRVTLSIGGLGFLDETEAETIPGAAMLEEPSYWYDGKTKTIAAWLRDKHGISIDDLHQHDVHLKQFKTREDFLEWAQGPECQAIVALVTAERAEQPTLGPDAFIPEADQGAH